MARQRSVAVGAAGAAALLGVKSAVSVFPVIGVSAAHLDVRPLRRFTAGSAVDLFVALLEGSPIYIAVVSVVRRLARVHDN